jgi:thiamine phosphate phosphatase / amino-HMP aminohydrolase
MQIIMDWDSTLTMHDTTAVIASIGYKNAARTENLNPKPWLWAEERYTRDYEAHRDTYYPKKEQRTTIDEESAWLGSLGDVERQSFERVKTERVFERLSKQSMQEAGAEAVRNGTVSLRPGWEEVFAMTVPPRTGTGALSSIVVVSVGWSEAFIRGCLLEVASRLLGIDALAITLLVQRMRIYANEIVETGRGPALHTSMDKKRVLSVMERSRLRVYVGDSVTDFDCLLEADIGICIRDYPAMSRSQAELASTLSRVGVEVEALEILHGTWDRRDQDNGPHRSSLWWTSDLREVGRLRSLIL